MLLAFVFLTLTACVTAVAGLALLMFVDVAFNCDEQDGTCAGARCRRRMNTQRFRRDTERVRTTAADSASCRASFSEPRSRQALRGLSQHIGTGFSSPMAPGWAHADVPDSVVGWH